MSLLEIDNSLLRIIRSALAILLLLLAFGCSARRPLEAVKETRVLMDTFATITVYDRDKEPDSIHSAIHAAFEGMTEIERLTNNYCDSSEISQINRASSESRPISLVLARCISEAQRISELSDGCFDIGVGPLMELWNFLSEHPTVPSQEAINALLPLVDFRAIDLKNGSIRLTRTGMALDLGGIAKGLAVDVAIDSLRMHGISDAMVDTGSNLRTIASNLTSGRRRVWIRHPRDRSKLLAGFRMDEGCVASSGDYERFFIHDSVRYHHILNPHTGWPARGCVSVTVVAGSAIEADALSTAIFVMGHEKGLEFAERLPEVEAVILIENQGKIEWRASKGLQGKLEIL